MRTIWEAVNAAKSRSTFPIRRLSAWPHGWGCFGPRPFEGLTAELIIGRFGRPSEIVENPPLKKLHYTDDTQMTIALAEVLCAHGAVDENHLMAAFAAAYDPSRGYGTGARRLLEAGPTRRGLATSRLRRCSPGRFLRKWACAHAAAAPHRPVVSRRSRPRVERSRQIGSSVSIATIPWEWKEIPDTEGRDRKVIACGDAADHDAFFRPSAIARLQEEYQWLLRNRR